MSISRIKFLDNGLFSLGKYHMANGFATNNGIGRDGNSCLRMMRGAFTNGFVYWGDRISEQNWRFGCAVKYSRSIKNTFSGVFYSANNQDTSPKKKLQYTVRGPVMISCGINIDGTIYAELGDTTQIGSTEISMHPDTWYYIDGLIGLSQVAKFRPPSYNYYAIAAQITIWVNGKQSMSAYAVSDIDTNFIPTHNPDVSQHGWAGPNPSDYTDIDDIYVAPPDGPVDLHFSDHWWRGLVPISNGSVFNFSGSYLDIAEAFPDDDLTTIDTSTIGRKAEIFSEPIPAANNLDLVVMEVRARADDPTPDFEQIDSTIGIGSTTSVEIQYIPTFLDEVGDLRYTYLWYTFIQDSLGALWTGTQFDVETFGIKYMGSA